VQSFWVSPAPTLSTSAQSVTRPISMNNGDESSDDSVEHSDINYPVFASFGTHRGVNEAEISYIQANRNKRKRLEV